MAPTPQQRGHPDAAPGHPGHPDAAPEQPGHPETTGEPRPGRQPAAPDRAITTLQALVRIPTVSDPDPTRVDDEPFRLLHAHLEDAFPLLHARLERSIVHTHGLLFRWRGESDERPVVLMAHQDVVPVDPDAPWQHPPFAATIANGAVWGRGALDDKGSLVAICEAVERLLEGGFTPAQDVWLSFGCDEEVAGQAAPAAAAELTRRGVRPWIVLDEGGAVAGQAFPGISAPVAVIGVTEKGVTSLRLTVGGRGGHASTPAAWGPTSRLARALVRLERSPMPSRLPEPTVELLRRLGTQLPRPVRPVLAHAGRLAPVLRRLLAAAGPEAAAMTRTTIAATTLAGSPALNAIASTATAGLNARILVGDTVADVVAHVRHVIADDQVRIEVVSPGEASPMSPYADDEAFRLLERIVAAVFPEALTSPYVTMAATDSRFFTGICPRVYRFTPFRMSAAQRAAIHSYDERLAIDDLLDGVRWYELLLRGLA